MLRFISNVGMSILGLLIADCLFRLLGFKGLQFGTWLDWRRD